MARPIKEGIDYFPFDVDLITDRKLRRAKVKYGSMAVMVYISLLCILYKDKGYYIEYFGEKKEDVLWEVCENLQGKHQPDVETVERVIQDLVAYGLFSDDHFKSEAIITSHRAQRTYFGATGQRKAANINFDYWLLSENEMRELSSRHPILDNFINRPINEVNQSNNSVNQSNNTQSRVEKSRVEKSNKHIVELKPDGTSKKEKNQPLVKEVVAYLNKKCKKNYRPSTAGTKKHIEARINEGFGVDDFKKVIDIKNNEWSADDSMSKFLRPETLFGNKFESYLNQEFEIKKRSKWCDENTPIPDDYDGF